MKHIAGYLVDKRAIVAALFVPLVAAALFFAFRVTVNGDLTKYLPEGSNAKAGIAVMAEEFPAASSFKLMLQGVAEADKAGIQAALSARPNVSAVSHDDTELYNQGDKTLYTLNLSVAASTPEVDELTGWIKDTYKDLYKVTMSGDAMGNTARDIMSTILVAAVIIALVILFALSDSWLEPLLFLTVMLAAVALNMGSNAMFASVSDTTQSIAAVLQMCLSMDYSIMLLSRYRQEKAEGGDNPAAMKRALTKSFAAISASSVTTIAGMLALTFMSFTIGRDMGLVLAKGVFLSLFCIFTLMPALILLCDKWLEKTRKPGLTIPMGGAARLSYRFRPVVAVLFVIIFIGSYFLQGNVNITYTLTDFYPIETTFPPQTQLVVIYDNADEAQAAEMAREWQFNRPRGVKSVSALGTTVDMPMTYAEAAAALSIDEQMAARLYAMQAYDPATTARLGEALQFMQQAAAQNPQFSAMATPEALAQLGQVSQMLPMEMLAAEFTAADVAEVLKLDPAMMTQLYIYRQIYNGETPTQAMTMERLVAYLNELLADNPAFAQFLGEGDVERLAEAQAGIDAAKGQFVGAEHSRMIVTANFAVESPEMFALIDDAKAALSSGLSHEAYLVGDAAVAREMAAGFPAEMDLITLLTAVTIFVIVAVAFRSLSVPLALVLLIQSAVYVSMGVMYLQGSSMYYLPLLIVQCLLMGATVDYGILYASYYREARLDKPPKEAVVSALNRSMHTILTSASILVIVTGIIGFGMMESNRPIAEILMTISRGGLCAFLLVVFILPGVLCAFDRFVAGKNRLKD